MFYDVALPRIQGYDDPPTSDPMVASLHEKSELQRNWHEYADGTIACVLPRANLEISGKRVGKYNNSLPTLRGETSLHKYQVRDLLGYFPRHPVTAEHIVLKGELLGNIHKILKSY